MINIALAHSLEGEGNPLSLHNFSHFIVLGVFILITAYIVIRDRRRAKYQKEENNNVE